MFGHVLVAQGTNGAAPATNNAGTILISAGLFFLLLKEIGKNK